MKSQDLPIGFIGTGNMAKALKHGFYKKGYYNLFAASPNALSKKKELPFVHLTDDVNELCRKATLLILCVKPDKVLSVCKELPPLRKEQFIVSVAAGLSLESLTKSLPNKTSITRAMPNIACAFLQSMSLLCKNEFVSDDQASIIETLFNQVGKTAWLEREKDLHAATVLAGSGPALILFLINALIDSGCNEGLSKEDCSKILKQVLKGSSALLDESLLSTETLIENVTSPGGTTEAALTALKDNKIATGLKLAIIKGTERSKQIELNNND